MLSDHDFELLVSSLLEAEYGGHWEVFARGADRGVDVRRKRGVDLDVVQCKHMMNSTIAQLRAAARKEKKKLDALGHEPQTYRFVTSKPLTAGNKADLQSDLFPWIKNPSDIWGIDDLESLLGRHPSTERANVKLWLQGAGQLDAQLHSAIWQRSAQTAYRDRSATSEICRDS